MPLVSGSACADALQAEEPSLRLPQLSTTDAAQAALSERYDAIVRKVRKNDVEVFYAADDATRRHNLLVSGEDNYMVRDTRWKLKE